MTELHIITTGGTIDKVYFDALSEFQVGDSVVDAVLRDAGVGFSFALSTLMKKDSLDLTDDDRTTIFNAVKASDASNILITHGTDTMAATAERLSAIRDKTVVLTGAMQPARLKSTDALFNIGFAVAAARLSAPGVYIAMNGELFAAGQVVKDRAAGRFVAQSSQGEASA